MHKKSISDYSVITATIWSFLQRGGAIFISFISNMVLARLLCPEDFGSIGLILVFTSIADTLVDGGLGSALIQKKTVSKQDISTVFSSNLVLSIFLYVILFFIAPIIAEYVRVPRFDIYLRVQSLTIFIRAFYVVEFSLLNRRLQFKKLAKVNIIASIMSTITAITLATFDFGVWSLIIRNITLQISLLILLKLSINANLTLSFNKKSFSKLMSFGGYVSASNFMDFMYSNVATFIIGKSYSIKDLGYYTQANSLKSIPINTLSMVVNQIMFPFMSKYQDNKKKLINNTRKTISLISFFIFPVLFFLIVFAKPVILLFYSEKWLPSVSLFRILSFSGLVNALIHSNRSVLKSTGQSRLLFKSQIISTTIGLIVLFIGLHYSLITLLLLIVANSYLTYLTVAIFTQVTIGYKVWLQIKDISFNLLLSIAIGLICYGLTKIIFLTGLLFLFTMFIIYILLYLASHFIFKTKSYKLIKEIIVW